VRFKILTEVKISMLIIRIVNLCGVVDRYQRLGESTVSTFRLLGIESESEFSGHGVE
jgi:hypothetical protein